MDWTGFSPNYNGLGMVKPVEFYSSVSYRSDKLLDTAQLVIATKCQDAIYLEGRSIRRAKLEP